MPVVDVNGNRIHYSVAGAGPLVICQHGFFSRGTRWYQFGWVDALADRFTVAVVDSIGHGHSDKPHDIDPYVRPERAAHITAVADDLGADRFHFVGYSMGGWIGSALAEHAPDRLESLVIGGWGPASGMPMQTPFSGFLRGVRQGAPALVEWVTADVEPALDACFAQLYDLGESATAVASVRCPTLIWDGVDDVHYEQAEKYAESEGIEFLSVRGDHLEAMEDPSGESKRGVRAFLDRAAG